MANILIVDDEPRILLLLKGLLTNSGYSVVTAKDGASALEAFRNGQIDIVITDLRMSPMDGMQLFREIHKLRPETPVVLLTAYASVETAIAAMREGVFDYLTKPFKVDDMTACLKRAEEKISKSRVVATTLAVDEAPRYRFEDFIAASEAMTQVCETIQKVAPTSVTVLINGESGTGKEVIARTLHKASSRADKPWVAVNCAALPENLLESEMFGHVKGSFTGAYADKEGLFEAANGGTLFLDEISSMPLILQGKLLRVLQEREIRRVGGTKDIPVDVRVIAASNANLEQAVVEGKFRSDLYYRFAVVTIDIPPLRKRTDDIMPLVRHFIRHELEADEAMPVVSAETVRVLTSYDWPGNVRELENAVRHAMTFWQEGELTPDLLPSKIRNFRPSAAPVGAPAAEGDISLKSFLRQKEKEYINEILSATNGDKEKAAETLKVNLSTLYRKLSDDPKS